MFLRLLKATVNAVIWVIKKAFVFLFHLINKCRLWVILFYLIGCGIVQLIWHVFDDSNVLLLFFVVLFVLLLITGYSFFFSFQRKSKKKQGKIRSVQKRGAASVESEADEPPESRPSTVRPHQITVDEVNYPRYYRIADNEDFVMAEYRDRYELFHDVNGERIYIRTDYKKRGNQ